jgi:hypothetical protein
VTAGKSTRDKFKDNADIIVAVLVILGMLFGGITYFAKASDLKQVEYRLDEKIKADKIYYLKQQLWMLYKKHKTKDCLQMPEPDCDVCKSIKTDLENLSPNVKI